jgi:catechol-2,3-dioxygenase
MTINHINLVVTDVESVANFFEIYFEFSRTLIKGNNIIAVLENKKGFSLVLSSDKSAEITYPKDFHIGFMQETREQVQALYDRLKSGGIELGRPPGKIRNSYAFYFYFDSVFIEVGCIF